MTGRKIACSLFFLVLFSILPGHLRAESPCMQKKIIGQTCWVHIEELDLDFLARIDTGATSTSLHATDFIIDDGTDDPRDNVGRTINFVTMNRTGAIKSLDSKIVKLQAVNNVQGREKRYMVRLTLSWNGIRKPVLVNLRDRSAMRYKLLIGRNWIADDFLVDIDQQEEGEEAEEE